MLVRFIADGKIGKRLSRFAPPSQRKVSAGKIHCRSKDWEKTKQICSSITITAWKDKLVLVGFIADGKIGRRQSRFAPPSQRKVRAGKIHGRSKDWEETKQICSSIIITAGKLGKTSCW